MPATTSSVGCMGPRALSSAILLSALRVMLLRFSMLVRPSPIARPSQITRVSGATTAASRTSARSRGEIRSQKSRARSETADIATSHAWGRDRDLELLDAVGQRVGWSARQVVLEALDLLELGDQEVDL